MDNIPTEGSLPGTILALVVVLAPALAILIAATVPSKRAAFVLALLASGGVIGAGIHVSLAAAPGSGTQFGAAILGGWGGGLSLLMTSLIVSGRAVLQRGRSAEQGRQ